MSFVKRMAVLFTVTLLMFVGTFLLLCGMQWIEFKDVSYLMFLAYYHPDAHLGLIILAAVVLLVNFFFYSVFSVNVHRDKIIAFDNPSGRVTLSLFAMEDLLNKIIGRLGEIRDVKTHIIAKRRGLDVTIRLTLASEMNIPDVTSKVQSMAEKKIQDTIGVDEKLNISVYVGKILSPDKNDRKDKKGQTEDMEPIVPFQGYRP